MTEKQRAASSAFLLFPILLCLPVHGEDARTASEALVTVTPEPTDEILANPGMGWERRSGHRWPWARAGPRVSQK
jgi:hypothetical protein